VVEGGGLENRYLERSGSRVRIPLSPPENSYNGKHKSTLLPTRIARHVVITTHPLLIDTLTL
jgi:hypothetical protein